MGRHAWTGKVKVKHTHLSPPAPTTSFPMTIMSFCDYHVHEGVGLHESKKSVNRPLLSSVTHCLGVQAERFLWGLTHIHNSASLEIVVRCYSELPGPSLGTKALISPAEGSVVAESTSLCPSLDMALS